VDEWPIGRRVAYWRRRRRLSQQMFADRLGKSKSWVDKVERGVRRLDRFPVVYEIAEVLSVDPQVLLDRPPGARDTPTDRPVGEREVAGIRAALERYDHLAATGDPDPPPDLAELHKAVRHAWSTYQHARGGSLARLLPELLRSAQATDATCAGGAHGAASANLLGQVYQITSSALRNVGEHQLAWLAADRAVAVAQRSGDELLVGVATFRVGMALLALGRPRSALEINVSAAHRLAPDGGRPDPQRLSVFGMLVLQGAMAAASIGDESTVRELLAVAEEAATRLGGDHNHYWSCFGPTNVQLHRVAAAVALGDGRAALAAHERIRSEGLAALVPERRLHHLLDAARGCAQLGDIGRAGALLVETDRIAPAELRSRPAARRLVGDVLRRVRGEPPPALRELAASVGVAG
jgi:transcriptional regulator with XRE-family HTH domain